MRTPNMKLSFIYSRAFLLSRDGSIEALAKCISEGA